MARYEIMLIVDPKEDLKNVETLSKEVFKDGQKKFTKMDRKDLAYTINKSNTAQYVLIDAEVTGEEIKEFTRRVNITKTIWRQLAINLDQERAMDSLKNMKKFEEMKARKAAERAAYRETTTKEENKENK